MPITLLLALSSVPSKAASALRQALHSDPLKSFSSESTWGLHQQDPAYAELIDWARLQNGRLFCLPPYDNRYMTFRYAAGKGVYAHQSDINQLAYSPDYYYQAYERLLKLGLVTANRPKYRWHWNYDALCSQIISEIPADYFVFEKGRMPRNSCGTSRVVFENREFIVYGKMAITE